MPRQKSCPVKNFNREAEPAEEVVRVDAEDDAVGTDDRIEADAELDTTVEVECAESEQAVPRVRKIKKGKSRISNSLSRRLARFDFHLCIRAPRTYRTRKEVFLDVTRLFLLGKVTLAASSSTDELSAAIANGSDLYLACLEDGSSYELLWDGEEQVESLEVTSSTPVEILSSLVNRQSFFLLLRNANDGHFEMEVRLQPAKLYVPEFGSDPARRRASSTEMKRVVEHFYNIPCLKGYVQQQHSSRENMRRLYTQIRERQKADPIPSEYGELDVRHPALKATLRPYQVDAVRWMVYRERRPMVERVDNFLYEDLTDAEGKTVHYCVYGGFFASKKLDLTATTQPGGILADEMGLGKTVELLACTLLNPKPEPTVDARPHNGTAEESGQIAGSEDDVRLEEDRSPRFECFCGELGSSDYVLELVQCSECGVYQHPACTKADVDEDHYLCPHCWVDPAREPLKIKATLIVCPSSILFQWLEEIEKHQTSMSVFVYEGVQKQGFVSPAELARYDIVLLTYEGLGKEIHLADLPRRNGDARVMRKRKKFLQLPSPLLAVEWWRVCLDEAQMVESATAQCAQMALRLSAVNRWCVTGTPIQKGLKDLYGLLLFLGEEPYNVEFWWRELLLGPYYSGNEQPLVDVLAKCFRRTKKKDVLDQIGIPPQEDRSHTLHFSAVEDVFYKRQAQSCNDAFAKEVCKFSDATTELTELDLHSVSLLLKPLMSLRQACCHPQAVRGKFLPLRTDSLTIDELLTCLIKKTTTECEEAHRLMIAAMNGLAGIHLIRDEVREAADMYREVLWSAKEHSKDFKTDKLQQLHAIHNLALILESHSEGPKGLPSNHPSEDTGEGVLSDEGVGCVSASDDNKSVEASSDVQTTQECGARSPGCVSSAVETGEDIEIKETSRDVSSTELSYGAGGHEDGVVPGTSCDVDSEVVKHEGGTDADSDATECAEELDEDIAEMDDADCNKLSVTNSLESTGEQTLEVHKTDSTEPRECCGGNANRLSDTVLNAACTNSSSVDGESSAPSSPRKVSAETAARGRGARTYIPRAVNDDRLQEDAAVLRKSYLEKYTSKIEPLREQMKEATRVVEGTDKKFELPRGSAWWNALLSFVVAQGRADWLVDKVKADLENRKSSVVCVLKDRFTNIHGLQFVLHSELTKLQDTRKCLQEDVRGLSPQPSAQDVAAAVDCHLRPRKKNRSKCRYCVAHDKFNVYESRLFCFDESRGHTEAQDKESALLLKTRYGNWGDSELEKAVRCLCRHAAMARDKAVSADANLHVQLFAALKAEFRAMRAYYMQVRDYAAALDELEMATVRLEVQLPDPTSVGERDGGDDAKPINVLRPWEVDEQCSKLLTERQLHKTDLRKKLGQLFYLQNLEKGNSIGDGSANTELCPVCHSALGEKWSVLQCGHAFCIGCIQVMLSTPRISHAGSIKCAVCRACCTHQEVFYVETRARNHADPDIEVKGNYSTKVEAVVRTVLKIRLEDPTAKAIVFSKWASVIDILKKALEDNNVSTVCLERNPQFRNNLALFRHDQDVSVLLMPLALGAKGLNITEATHVLLVEPNLNLGEEMQAIGRVHRIGQTRKTFVHRFVVQGTIEEKIVEYMKTARRSGDELQEQSEMTVGDLRKLFD